MFGKIWVQGRLIPPISQNLWEITISVKLKKKKERNCIGCT